MTFRITGLAGLALLTAGLASAALVTTTPVGGTTTTFPGGTGIFSGPGAGTVAGFPITYTSGVVYDYDGGFGMGDNGSWDWGMIGINTSTGAMTIDLGGLYSSVGGFMNYSPDNGDATISAIAADGTTILESYVLSTVAPISTPGATNGGAYRGIERLLSEIRYFRIENSYLGMHDITLDGRGASAIPEPSTVILTIPAAFALWWRRRRSAA
ncbi:MAG: PEP-CTERM sorting domain-containing protein [Bryobacteraceae bacterium]|nr:PEP-CTERM sorting domain-containing protein [Bryobacteraceae bacterium]